MNKFTIFTIILAVSVITVTVDLVLRDYFGKEEQTSILREESIPAQDTDYTTSESKPSAAPENVKIERESVAPAPETVPISSEIIPQPKSLINEKLIKDAGFIGDLKEQQFSGRVFQLLDITKNPVESVNMYQVFSNDSPLVSITEIALKDEIRALQLYILLQNKTKTYIDLTLNETNAYGDRSFYVNHAKKPDEAFLTVKIGKNLYSFAYVKVYHPQVKKLIEILNS